MPTINMRVSDEQQAEIDRRAQAHGYPNRTAFLLDLALGDPGKPATDARFDSIEDRVSRLEASEFGQ